MISVLLPTRGRANILPGSIESLLEKAGDADDIQICYAVDADDTDTIKAVQKLTREHDIFQLSRRHGYAGLHHYVNSLAREAAGDWLFLWNDDAIMQSYGWDWRVNEFKPRYILDCWSNHPAETCAFPIVPRRLVQAVGHFSLSPHNDTWWQYIGAHLHRLVRLDVDVLHNRFDMTGLNDDTTYREKLAEHQTVDFYGPRNTELLQEDCRVISKLLAQQRDARLRGEVWEWTSDGSG